MLSSNNNPKFMGTDDDLSSWDDDIPPASLAPLVVEQDGNDGTQEKSITTNRAEAEKYLDLIAGKPGER